MEKRRRAPNKTEKIAALLLTIKRGDGWLIPEPLRSSGDAAAICSHVQWDHLHPHALGGDTRPQNMDPKDRLEHKPKTRRDMMNITKAKRADAKIEEARRLMLAPSTPTAPRAKPKQLMEYTRLKKTFKRKVAGKVVLRESER